VAGGAFEAKAVVGGDKLNLEIAKKQVEQAGAGRTTTELAGNAIDAIGGALEKFGKWFSKRGESRSNKAQKQEARATNIRGEIAARAKTAEQQKILNAQAREMTNGKLGVNRGLWGETGGRIFDVIKGGLQENVDKKWNEYRAKANETVAKKFINRAETFGKGSVFIQEAADRVRGLTRTVVGEVGGSQVTSLSLEDQRKAAGAETVKTAGEALTESTDRADQAQTALDRVREEKYFMPDAVATGKDITAAGGDQGFTKTAEKTADWVGRAAGTSSTS